MYTFNQWVSLVSSAGIGIGFILIAYSVAMLAV